MQDVNLPAHMLLYFFPFFPLGVKIPLGLSIAASAFGSAVVACEVDAMGLKAIAVEVMVCVL